MAKVLVTGAGGFVGSHLVPALLEYGDEVFAAAYSESPALSPLLPADHLLTGDLTDYAFTKNCLTVSRPDIIYHLAALSVVHTDVDAARLALTNNLALQFNLLEAIMEASPTSRLLAVCSGNVYGLVKQSETPIKETNPLRPLNAYSVSKLSQELLALQYFYAHNLDVVVLRPFNHTGPGQSESFVIPAFARQFALIKKGRQEPIIKLGNLHTSRDFTDVTDMVQAYLLATAKCKSGEIYNIGSGRASTIGEILTFMQEITGLKVELKEDSSLVRGVDVPLLMADSAKFRQATGWNPKIPFKQTLTNVLQYWEEQVL